MLGTCFQFPNECRTLLCLPGKLLGKDTILLQLKNTNQLNYVIFFRLSSLVFYDVRVGPTPVKLGRIKDNLNFRDSNLLV